MSRCRDCPLEAGDRFRCDKCRAARAASNVRWRAKTSAERDAANLCRRCGEVPRPDDHRWCAECRHTWKLARIAWADAKEATCQP